MSSFSVIVLGAVALGIALFGVGRLLRSRDPAACAVLRGWTVFMALCCIAWFAGLPASYLAPVLWLMFAVGIVTAIRVLPRAVLVNAVLGSAMIAATFALPFALHDRLMAYAHWGTDQWGYAAVSKWLVLHSVNELPVIDYKPGLDWVWKVLISRERPLIYLELAAIASALGLETIIVYFLLPAAAMIGVFLAIFLEDTALGLTRAPIRFFAAIGITLQPIVWLHFQHQFLAGTIAALMVLLLLVAVGQNQLQQPGEPLFFASAALFAVLVGGIYTTRVTLALLVMLVLIAGAIWIQREPRERLLKVTRVTSGIWVAVATLTVLAAGVFFMIRRLAPEPLDMLGGRGESDVLAQCGALFGLTDITPWYQRAGALGTLNVDPSHYQPPGSVLGVVLLGGLMIFLGIQTWRWWRQTHDLTPLAVVALAVAAIVAAAPPRGDNVLLSRTLPVFGVMLLILAAATAALKQPRWSRAIALLLAMVPVIRAAPGMWSLLARPANTMIEGAWNKPPNQDTWGALAYAYFYQDTRSIDWTEAPEAFQEMTHYMPPKLRPKMRRED